MEEGGKGGTVVPHHTGAWIEEGREASREGDFVLALALNTHSCTRKHTQAHACTHKYTHTEAGVVPMHRQAHSQLHLLSSHFISDVHSSQRGVQVQEGRGVGRRLRCRGRGLGGGLVM